MGYVSHARYKDSEARQAAYRIWRESPDTPIAQLLPRIEAEIGAKLALRSVQDWRHRDRWDERKAIEELDAAAVFVTEGMRGLRVAFPLAVSYLSSVVEGSVKPNALRIRAAQVLIAENRAFVELVKDRLLAPIEPAELAHSDFDALGDAELLELEQGLGAAAAGGGSGPGGSLRG